ncbi:MAG: (deoxy)nucleoside triphosphate pyrophosphohydrolase [Succinivibrionaceae bacterium]
MKVVKVVAAVISRDNQIFATQRGYGDFKGGWEFPGGKLEEGEKDEQALVREIREELDIWVEVGDLAGTVEYDYPKFHLSMNCYWCTCREGEIKLLEAMDGRWLNVEDIDTVDWLPADITLVKKLKEILKQK